MAFLPLANSNLSPGLRSLTQALIGEFSNPQQAIASPAWFIAWFVHLRLWHGLGGDCCASFRRNHLGVRGNR